MNKIVFIMIVWYSLIASTTFAFDRQDTLRGSNGRGRSWWDVQHYALGLLNIDNQNQEILGSVDIRFKVVEAGFDSMQIDLQDSLTIESVLWSNVDTAFFTHLKLNKSNNPEFFWRATNLSFEKDGNVYWIKFPFRNFTVGSKQQISIVYSGKPRVAKSAPWDGGLIWMEDSTGNPWIAVACQGLGASSWWPCKDYQGDEPDQGMTIYSNEANLIANGKSFIDSIHTVDPITTEVRTVIKEYSSGRIQNPINTYNATFYIGDYISWTDTLIGEKGKLDLSFHGLRYNEEKA
ncbi:MAG TPA: hypothetical protein PL009_14680, partial [Flavipsychrobacter sp.]|nr:hypothetical protein [Flavipsychrobacter sp.]